MLFRFYYTILQNLVLPGDIYLPVSVGEVALVSGAAYSGYLLFCYLFLGFGLYTMAKRQHLKIAFLAWIPLASFYLVGKLAGDVGFFGVKAKWIALVVLILNAVTLAFKVAGDVCLIPLLSDTFGLRLSGETYGYIYGISDGQEGIVSNGVFMSEYYNGILLGYAGTAVGGVAFVANVFLMYVLFLNYSPRSAWVFTILSFFVPVLWPILVFVIRKNSSGEYREYMRMKMHSMYGGGNPYSYKDGTYRDPYDLSQNANGKSEKPESPFGEFDDKQ